MKNHIFKSKRLGFRNWVESDKKTFAKMCSDTEVMTYFPSTLTKLESDNLIQRLQTHYTDFGFTFYAVDVLETSKFIGFIGMINTNFEAYFTPCVEIGWRLQKESWGKGFATEGAKRCLEYGFDTLKFKEIVSITAPDNKNSEHVMLKIGMQKEGEFEHPKLPNDHWLKTELLYKIKK